MTRSSNTGHGGTIDSGRNAWVVLVVALLLTVSPPTVLAQDAPDVERTERPLTVQEVVEFESLALRSPIRLSPDGRRLAYTVAGSQRPLGSVLELVKDSARATAGIRVADLETGQIIDLTPGAESWAPAWSPDGSTLAFYSTRSGEPLLWTWSPDGGLRRPAETAVWPAFMDQTPRWADRRTVVVKLLPEGQSVSETARRARPWAPEPMGREGTSVQLFRAQEPDREAGAFSEWVRWAYGGDLATIDVRSGSVTRVADDQLIMWWNVSPDSSTLAFSAIAAIEDEQAGFTIHTVPVAGGPVQALEGRLIRPFGDGVSWSPSGDRLAYVSEDGVYVVRKADGQRERVADARPGWADDAGPVWSSDGRYLVFTDGELWRLPLDDEGGPERIAAFDDRTIHAVVTGTERVPARTAGGEWLLRVGDDDTGETGFARVDPTTGTRSAERLQPGTMSANLRLAAAAEGSRVVVSYANATRAPELWLLGSDLAPARQVSRMNPAFDSVALGETRQVTWTTRTGDTVHGALTLPPGFRGEAPVPLLVEVYGGSRVGASPHSFDRYRQLFATHGYAVFVPGIPLEVGRPMRGHADAVVPGLEGLIEDGIADPERLGVFGHSYGGYGTLALLVQTDRFSAAVAAAAQGNLVGEFGQLAEDGTGRSRWAVSGQGRMGTTPWDDPRRYIENSPLFYLDRIRAPLLLLHGTEDQAVPLHLAGEIFVGLQYLGRTVTLARYAGEGHAWRAWRTPNTIDYWQRTLDWFDEHLGHGVPERREREVAVPTPTTGQSDDPPAIRIEDGTDGRLGEGNVVHIEPHLAVHPEDPDRMVVAVMTLPEPGGDFRIRVYRSTDGGGSWESSALTSGGKDADAVGVDPWLAYGPDGALYFAKLPGEVWRSADDGRSWSGPVTLPPGTSGGYDAPQMKVDRTGGPYHGRVYVSIMQSSVPRAGGESDMGVAVLRSGDGARSFGGPVHLTMNDVGKRHGDLAVLPDGTLLVTFHDLFHDGRVPESPRLWSARSEDGGETFTTPSLITERFLALSPLLAVDRDGPYRGRAYAAWLGLGGDRNRYLAYTDNGGDSWSDPTQVTALPDSSRHPTSTAVAVSSDGTVGLMWAENVVADGASCFEYRFAASVDGGETFSEPVAVSDSLSCSDTEAHRVVMHDDGPRQATVLERFPQGGDYFGLVALPDGAFQAVWPDARTGVFQLWTDRIHVAR